MQRLCVCANKLYSFTICSVTFALCRLLEQLVGQGKENATGEYER